MDDAAIAESLYGSTPTPAAPAQRSTEDITAEIMYGKPPAKPAPTKPISDPAEIMYGGPDTEPVVDSEPREPRTEAEHAAALFGKPEAPAPLAEVPPEVQELRDSPERRMFDAQSMLREVVPDLTDEQCEAEGADPAVVRQGLAELREVAADLDIGTLDVQSIRQRAGMLREAPVDPIVQRESAVEALNREFGNGAHQAWLDARALVARDPRVARMIETLNLGDDAETIVMLAKKARSQRASGKLKTRI